MVPPSFINTTYRMAIPHVLFPYVLFLLLSRGTDCYINVIRYGLNVFTKHTFWREKGFFSMLLGIAAILGLDFWCGSFWFDLIDIWI
jgi:hypothetical protein